MRYIKYPLMFIVASIFIFFIHAIHDFIPRGFEMTESVIKKVVWMNITSFSLGLIFGAAAIYRPKSS